MNHPPQPRADAERDAFIRWAKQHTPLNMLMHPTRGCFAYTDTENHYAAFQAGRAQALAEVAKRSGQMRRFSLDGNVARMFENTPGAWVKFKDVVALIARPQPDAPEGGKQT